MKNYSGTPKSDSDCRSLLQKAVRRAHPEIAKLAVIKLIQDNDLSWLKSRLGIIATEECWQEISNVDLRANALEIILHFEHLANSKKDKTAAGLGSLSYELSLGDTSVLDGLDKKKQRDLKIIAEALKRPDDFWKWVNTQELSTHQALIIKNSEVSYRLAGWPWDKSFSITTAYLATNSFSSPNIEKSTLELPYWIAIDKHTPRGKRALSMCAEKFKIDREALGWIQFYLESSKCANISDSFWWQHEINWRFKKHLINPQKAEILWRDASFFLKEHLQSAQESLQHRLELAKIRFEKEINEQQNLI